MSPDHVVVDDNARRHRFEALVDQQVAGFAQYRDQGAQRAFIHTVIEPAYQGRGLASQLISAALAETRARGLAVLPFCPFVRSYLLKHPAELGLVPAPERARFGLPPEAAHA